MGGEVSAYYGLIELSLVSLAVIIFCWWELRELRNLREARKRMKRERSGDTRTDREG